MNKVRFSEIKVGDSFIAFGLTIKKNSLRAASSVSLRNKQHFIFNGNELVQKEEFTIFIPKIISMKINSVSMSYIDEILALAKNYREENYSKNLMVSKFLSLPVDNTIQVASKKYDSFKIHDYFEEIMENKFNVFSSKEI